MEFKATQLSIEDCLRLKRKFIIPRFQREYSWESDELNALWEDLWDNIKFANNTLSPQEYFLGSLVLVGDDDNSSNIERHIVDGQQRLMTFTIIFSIIYQYFLKIKEEKLAIATFTNILSVDSDGNEYTKLVAETPKPFFQHKVQSKNQDDSIKANSAEEKKILSAYNFFEKKLEQSSLLKELSSRYPNFVDETSKYSDILKVFRDQILACKVVYVTVKNFEDAYTIFEVLNGKGKELSPLDIIKNSIFKILTREEPLDLASEKWTKIRKNISECDEDIITFYRHYWLSRHSFSTTKNLLKHFNKYIDANELSYTEFLNEVEKNSLYYKKITAPSKLDWDSEGNYDIYESLKALQIFSTTQIKTLLLALFEIKEKKLIKHHSFKKELKDLEGFHFIFTATCSSRASGLERKYSSYARRLRQADSKTDSSLILSELISSLANMLPEYSIYENKFMEITYTSEKTQRKSLVQYILRKYERLCATTNELVPLSLTIEHIIPESTRESHIGLIGNLLPLSGELNSQIGNNSFAQKIISYQQSNYHSVKKFCDEYKNKTEFGQHDITDRTKKIAKAIFDTWDFPSQSD